MTDERDNGNRAAGPRQEGHWETVAPRWWAWREVMEGASRPVSERMVARAGLFPGARVLDVATGFGEPALTAAEAVGVDGLVAATDLSPAMLALARQRARERGLFQVRCARMNGAAPAFASGTFDAVLCRWGLMALTDPPGLGSALAGLRRVLRPGGRLVAAVWAGPEQVPSIALPLAAARRALGLPSPQGGERGPFRLADEAVVVSAMRAAGFVEVDTEAVNVAYRFASAEAFTRFCRETSSPVLALLQGVPEAVREAVWDEVARAARQRADADGQIRLDNRALCVFGSCPGAE